MNVLSLFDGMSCGRIALERAGIPVTNCFASEVDKHAIKVSSTKWPDIVHLGDVTKVSAKDLPPIGLLIAGSPCQGFSFAGKGLNFNDPRSALFFEYVRILNECREKNPNVLFLLENVQMKKEHEDVISRILDIQPININSSLVSAQNRERLYWTNIAMSQRGLFGDNYCTIQQPKDKGIYLIDILQTEVEHKYFLSGKHLSWFKKNIDIQLLKGYSTLNAEKSGTLTARGYASWNGAFVTGSYLRLAKNHRDKDEKANCLLSTMYKGAWANGTTLISEDEKIRRLTPIECSRLQTVPDDYFYQNGQPIVSETQMYKMLGNGWTVDVIVHIFNHIA